MPALDMDSIGVISVKQGGTWKECGEVLQLIAGTWVPLWQDVGPLTVAVDNASPSGARAINSTVSVSTSVVTLTIAGGVEPYSITWSRVDSGSPAWSISSPGALATRFSTDVAPGFVETAEFEATVTDAASTVVTSETIYAFAENFGGYL